MSRFEQYGGCNHNGITRSSRRSSNGCKCTRVYYVSPYVGVQQNPQFLAPLHRWNPVRWSTLDVFAAYSSLLAILNRFDRNSHIFPLSKAIVLWNVLGDLIESPDV